MTWIEPCCARALDRGEHCRRPLGHVGNCYPYFIPRLPLCPVRSAHLDLRLNMAATVAAIGGAVYLTLTDRGRPVAVPSMRPRQAFELAELLVRAAVLASEDGGEGT